MCLRLNCRHLVIQSSMLVRCPALKGRKQKLVQKIERLIKQPLALEMNALVVRVGSSDNGSPAFKIPAPA